MYTFALTEFFPHKDTLGKSVTVAIIPIQFFRVLTNNPTPEPSSITLLPAKVLLKISSLSKYLHKNNDYDNYNTLVQGLLCYLDVRSPTA